MRATTRASLWILVSLLYGFPYLVLLYFGLVNNAMPETLRLGFQDVFVKVVKASFNLKPIDLDHLEAAYSSPAKLSRMSRIHEFPTQFCGIYFMAGNPAADAIADTREGKFDVARRTLELKVPIFT